MVWGHVGPTCVRVGQQLCAVGGGPAQLAVALLLVVAHLGDNQASHAQQS